MGVGLVALVVTGVLAAVDRFQERAPASQAAVRPPVIKSPAAQSARIVEAPPAAPLVEAAPSPFPTSPWPPSAATAVLASNFAQGDRPPIKGLPVETPAIPAGMPSRFLAAFGEPAPEPVAPPATPPVAEQPRAIPDTPLATAVVAPPRPPVRQPEALLPPAAGAKGLKVSAAAPTECLPNELRALLADVAARFGDIAVVSTHKLNTGNHSSGSIREKLHHACNAVDFRPGRDRVEDVKKYLRGRPEIGGVESYRNGVVHMDLKGSEVASAQAVGGGRQAAAQTASAGTPQSPAAAPPVMETNGFFRLFGR